MSRSLQFALFALALIITLDAGAQPCPFTPWTTYADTPLLARADARAYLFVTDHMAVDADGAPNAYHPDDVGLHCTRGEGFKGLDCPANAGYPKASWWPDVLVPDATDPGRAHVQPDGAFAGYFVSKTALHDARFPRTDPRRYVDSRTVPYLVFPGRFFRMKGTGRLGDLGVAIRLSTGASSAFVVADIGPPRAPLGEISISLGARLGATAPNPRTGAGTLHDDVVYIVFPFSSRAHPWPLEVSEVESAATTLLTAAGGVDAVRACVAR